MKMTSNEIYIACMNFFIKERIFIYYNKIVSLSTTEKFVLWLCNCNSCISNVGKH